jgi:hypothetical protein
MALDSTRPAIASCCKVAAGPFTAEINSTTAIRKQEHVPALLRSGLLGDAHASQASTREGNASL